MKYFKMTSIILPILVGIDIEHSISRTIACF
nr:MAG TPA: hypothetical protein [Caudoviricetes sp.]